MESKMSRLASLLNVFKGSLSAVESTTFTHRDDVFMSLQKEAERIEVGRAGESRLELPSLEQLCEDLRALAYERKLGTAVSLLEDAIGRGDLISLNSIYAAGGGPYLAPSDVIRGFAHVPAATATSLANATTLADRYQHMSQSSAFEALEPTTPQIPGILAQTVHTTAIGASSNQSTSFSAKSLLDPFANATCIAQDNPMLYGTGSRVADPNARAHRGLSYYPAGIMNGTPLYMAGISAMTIDPHAPIQRLAVTALPVYGAVVADTPSFHDAKLTTALPLSVFSAAAANATSSVNLGTVQGINTVRRTVARVVDYLVRLIVNELSSDGPSRAERKALTTYLIRLGHTKRALGLFLEHRSNLLHGEIRLARLVGGSEAFIHDLANLTFGVIALTVKDVQTLFAHDLAFASAACAAWAAQEVAVFARAFARHVFMLSDPITELGVCLRVAANAAAEHSTKGLQLVPILGRAIHGVAREALRRSFRLAETQAADALSRDDWSIGELFVTGAIAPAGQAGSGASGRAAGSEPSGTEAASVRLTSSAQFFYDAVRQALPRLKLIIENEKQPQASIQVYPAVIASFIRLLDGYTMALQQVIRQSLNPHSETTLHDSQLLAVLANIHAVSTNVLPKLIRELQRYFRRPPIELLPYVDRATARRDAALDLLCELKALYWVRGRMWCKSNGKHVTGEDSILAWTNGADLTKRYSAPKPLPSDPLDNRVKISSPWVELANQLSILETQAQTAFGTEGARALMRKLLEHIFVLIYGEVGWVNFDPTLGGAQQLVLDMRWLLLNLRHIATSKTEYFCWSLCRRITRMITNPSDPEHAYCLDDVLRPDAYYEAVASNLSLIHFSSLRGQSAGELLDTVEMKQAGQPEQISRDDDLRSLQSPSNSTTSSTAGSAGTTGETGGSPAKTNLFSGLFSRKK